MRWPEPKRRIKKQIGMRTVITTITAASFMFAVDSHGERSIAILSGAVFAFLSFHWCLSVEEDEQFPYAFIGFFFLFVIFVLVRFM